MKNFKKTILALLFVSGFYLNSNADIIITMSIPGYWYWNDVTQQTECHTCANGKCSTVIIVGTPNYSGNLPALLLNENDAQIASVKLRIYDEYDNFVETDPISSFDITEETINEETYTRVQYNSGQWTGSFVSQNSILSNLSYPIVMLQGN